MNISSIFVKGPLPVSESIFECEIVHLGVKIPEILKKLRFSKIFS